MAAVSLWNTEIGKALNFIVTSGGSPIDLSGANVTLMLNDGTAFSCTLISALSATVRYIVQANDFPVYRQLIGQLRVSFDQNRFYTSTFELVVRPTVETF